MAASGRNASQVNSFNAAPGGPPDSHLIHSQRELPTMTLDQSTPTVTVCRGCCCGTTRKHPGFDHDAQLTRLRELLQDRANLRVTDCLGPCEKSNVIVVTPSSQGRGSGGRSTWLGSVLDTAAADELARWISAGGPGVAEPTHDLLQHRFERPTQRGGSAP
jgi:hypothetical protein